MRTWEVHQYYPLPWRLGEIVEVSGGKITSILAANGEKVAIWLDPGVAQVIVEAVNRPAAETAKEAARAAIGKEAAR